MLNPNKKLFRWGPISACPLFLYYTIEHSFKKMKNLLGECYPYSTIIFKDDKATWLLDMREFSKRSERFTKLNIYDPDAFERYKKIWKENTKKLQNKFEKIDKINFKTLAFDEFISVFKEFSDVYYKWWTHAMSVELVTITIEPALGEALKPYYKNKSSKQYNKAFSVLSAPLDLTFYRQEQRGLLEILKIPPEKKERALRKHAKKYHWIYNSYLEGNYLDENYFRKELEELEQDRENSIKLLEEINNYKNELIERKKEVYDEIGADDGLKEKVGYIEYFSILQDTRKAINFKADYYLEEFVKVIAKHKKIEKMDVKYLTHLEIIKDVGYEEVGERRNCFVINVSESGMEMISGDEAQVINDTFSNLSKTEGSMIHGNLASTGNTHYFRGTAKIVLSIDEIEKVEEGDVLVTTMTSPDFIIGMKKAGAIITDVGGMLSHAAIVSRELKKPCIVGTLVATTRIKDGDVVELHCGRGTIKVVRSG